MKKQEAIEQFGAAVVQQARELYETDFGKLMFEEDRQYPSECLLDDESILDYLARAKRLVEYQEKRKPKKFSEFFTLVRKYLVSNFGWRDTVVAFLDQPKLYDIVYDGYVEGPLPEGHEQLWADAALATARKIHRAS